YDERIPKKVVSGRHFDSWWKTQRHQTPELLNLTEQDLLDPDADIEDLATEYPDTWVQGDSTLPLAYSFGQLGAKGADGGTATVALGGPSRPPPRGVDWRVRGRREELLPERLRPRPKSIRPHLVPAPERARTDAATPHHDDPDAAEPFLEAVADELVALPGLP